MELRKFKIGKTEIEFANSSRSTSTGFAHETTMFVNGRRVQEATCYYINRTWECYRYQTVMRNAVYRNLENHIDYLKDKFKEENNYTKLTAKRKVEFDKVCKADPDVIFANKLLEKLR